jgi:hypothetical protein
MSSKNLDLNTKLSEYTQKMNEALAEKDDHIRQIKKLVNVSTIFGQINFNYKFLKYNSFLSVLKDCRNYEELVKDL